MDARVYKRVDGLMNESMTGSILSMSQGANQTNAPRLLFSDDSGRVNFGGFRDKQRH